MSFCSAHAQTAPRDRIAKPIDGSALTVLGGTTHPLARAEYDRGPVDPARHLAGMTIDFARTAEQEKDLDALLKAQQDPYSTAYHKWLTPGQFAARFAMSQADIDKVSAWLQSQGLTVDTVAESRNAIRFSGTAAQVERAFHVEIHNYVIGSETHFSNATAIMLPASLAGIVGRVGGLNDFKLKPRFVRPPGTGKNGAQPRFTDGSGNHALAPGDFAVIYDVDPLYTAGFTGTGMTIGVVGQTDIVAADIAAFRAAADLPANSPTVFLVPGSSDPGVQDASGDIDEADLDLEWSGGVAKDASIVYINSTGALDSLQYAIQNEVNGLVIPILSSSYGDCERNFAASDIAAYESYFKQANSQGQTIIGPGGDSGAADCDSTTSTSATEGLQVDYPASSAYVTGVGGSEFTADGTAENPSLGADQYWGYTAGSDLLLSALSYIPEGAWNDTTFSIANGAGLDAGGGGVSTVIAKPTWQSGVAGIPTDNYRDVPDLALSASNAHDPYIVCTQITLGPQSTDYVSSCSNGFEDNLTELGGTSAAAPAFAGILALIEQKLGETRGFGNINPTLYSLAQSPTDYATAFHDITTGDNMVPCTTGSTGCPNGGTIGYSAGVGYDQVTGLGSVDAANLASAMVGHLISGTGSGLTVSVANMTIASPNAGSQATSTITITSVGGYAGTLKLTATSSTLDADDIIAPATVSVSSGGTSTSTITIETVAASSATFEPSPQGDSKSLRRHLLGASGIGLGAMFLLGAPRRRKHPWTTLAGSLIFLAGISPVVGCSGNSAGSSGTGGAAPAGTYTVTVTATDTSNSSTTASGSFTVTIQ